MALKLGDVAPEFTLKDSDGNEVSLAAFKGNPVVLLFFPLAFTGVCTKELCSVRDNLSDYQDLDAEVLAISVDSFFTLAQFKSQQNLTFSLLSDFNKETIKAYDSMYDDFFGMVGVAKRSAFVVDRSGKLAYAEVLEKASELPNFDAIKETLSRI
jgi:glutaredoxin-dependent peroxiredoxin